MIPGESLLFQPVLLKCHCHTGCSHGDDGGKIVPPEVRRLRLDAVTHGLSLLISVAVWRSVKIPMLWPCSLSLCLYLDRPWPKSSWRLCILARRSMIRCPVLQKKKKSTSLRPGCLHLKQILMKPLDPETLKLSHCTRGTVTSHTSSVQSLVFVIPAVAGKRSSTEIK